jgi:hypothetical protein
VQAFRIGAKQGKDAINAIVFGYNLAAFQKRMAYSNVAAAVREHCENSLNAFPDENTVHTLAVLFAQLDKERDMGMRFFILRAPPIAVRV